MMERLRAMREPLKYVQGRDALLKFQEEMGYMGKRWLFVCSRSGYKACHDKIEQSFGDLDDYRRYEIFGGISSKKPHIKNQRPMANGCHDLTNPFYHRAHRKNRRNIRT